VVEGIHHARGMSLACLFFGLLLFLNIAISHQKCRPIFLRGVHLS
jgi:hypothetical protein